MKILSIRKFKKSIISLSIVGILLIASSNVHAVLGDQILKRDMTHEDVMILQQELKQLGYFNHEETTTYYGEITEKAVMEFQESQDLKVDGIFDETTFEAIKKFRKSPLVYNEQLKLGMKGQDIKELQEVLKYLGYLDIDNCTDYFGPMTEASLTSFQRAHDLVADGITGARTIDLINNILAGRIPSQAPNRSGGRSEIGENIGATARKFQGARYASGGNGPSSFDCSGFTSYIYSQFGITLPRTSAAQASAGIQVNKANIEVGDLLIFSNTYRSGPSHTGVYLGNNKFIHASTPSTGVIISDLNSAYYRKHFSYGRRVY